jgi:hypothetical protein
MTSRLLGVLALLLSCWILPASVVRAQGYGGGGDAVDCESRNYSYIRCEVPWRDARLVRQISDTSCIRGRNWGIDRRGIWVDRGCGGRFVEAGRHHGGGGPDYGGGWRPGPGWDSRFAVRCGSEDYRYNFCAVDLGGAGRAYVSRMFSSKSPCVEGRTWGWNRAGIWVDQGCDAEFTIDRRWH